MNSIKEKEKEGSIVLLLSDGEKLRGIAIESATEKQTERLCNLLKEIFREEQIVELSGNPNPGGLKLGRMD